MNQKLRNLVYTAMLMALCCVATLVIKIPTVTGGYLNAGDIVVVLAALLAGPLYGGVAAGFGSGLADVISGYMSYAPGTLVVKGCAAVVAALIFDRVKDLSELEKKQYLDLNLWLPGDILLKADKMSMAHSLELRVPYLDREVLREAECYPDSYKLLRKELMAFINFLGNLPPGISQIEVSIFIDSQETAIL